MGLSGTRRASSVGSPDREPGCNGALSGIDRDVRYRELRGGPKATRVPLREESGSVLESKGSFYQPGIQVLVTPAALSVSGATHIAGHGNTGSRNECRTEKTVSQDDHEAAR